MIYKLTEVSYAGSSHKKDLGYFYHKYEGLNWLKKNGYIENKNFDNKEIWEHPKDEDWDVWVYVELNEINKLE